MLKNPIFQFIAISLLAILFFKACAKDSDNNHSTVLNIRMTDDPLANVQQVNIDLLRIITFTNDGKDSFEIGTNAGIYNLLD